MAPDSLVTRAIRFCAIACLAGAALPQALPAAEAQTVHRFEKSLTRSVGYQYLLSLPTGYATSPDKRWPVLMFLHGSGERGDDIWQIAKHGPPKLLREPGNDPAARQLADNFIVISPQCPKNRWWDAEALSALLDDVMASHRTDPRRVYLTGLSMGGYGTWELGLRQATRFAAIVPICGGGSFTGIYLADAIDRSAFRSLGVWAFHGAKDESVPLAESQRMVDRLKAAKVTDVQLTIYPEARHDSWTAAYATPELYAWLLRHERPDAR